MTKLYYTGTEGFWVTDGLTVVAVAPSEQTWLTAIRLGREYIYSFGGALWETDGTPSGAMQLMPAAQVSFSLSPHEFFRVRNKVGFIGNDASGLQGLFSTDGTAA